MGQDGVAIVKMSSLRPGQRSLYELIVSKVDTADKITLREAENIWRTKVHSNNTKDGTPWLFFWCKEHKCLSFRFYVPRNSTYFTVSTLSNFSIDFTNDLLSPTLEPPLG